MIEVAHFAVFWGQGGGTFAPRTDYPAGASPISLSVADLDGDGSSDVFITNDLVESLAIAWGDSARTLADRTSYPLPFLPRNVTAVDINDDGILDLVTTSCNGDEVYALLGKGERQFGPAIKVFSWPGLDLCGITPGNINGDRFGDIVVLAPSQDWAIVGLGRADGGFDTLPLPLPGFDPTQAVLADMNGDGINDLSVANGGSHDASIMLGRGDGNFDHSMDIPTFACSGVAVGDLDGDSSNDLVLEISCGHEELVHYNRRISTAGTAQFIPAVRKVGSSAASVTAIVALPTGAGYNWLPEEVHLLWREEPVGQAVSSTPDSLRGTVSFTFAPQSFDKLRVGDQTLAIEGCEPSGRAFRASGSFRVLSRKSAALWQASLPGMDPIVVQLASPSANEVWFEIFDSGGREVFRSRANPNSTGQMTWNGRGNDGRRLPTGAYYLKLGRSSGSCKIILLR